MKLRLCVDDLCEQEKLERTREKRDELREQLAVAQNDLEESKRAHRLVSKCLFSASFATVALGC